MHTTSYPEDHEVQVARSSGSVSAIENTRWVRIHGLLRVLFVNKVFETAISPKYLKISVLAETNRARSVRIFSSSGRTPLHSAVLVRKPAFLARLAPLIAIATHGDNGTLWEVSGPAASVSAHERLALRMPVEDAPYAFNVQPFDEGFDFTCPKGHST